MLREVAATITENIDTIVRRWVDGLRASARTEVHNTMLTSEIVDSMKVMLANIAAGIAQGSSPSDDTVPISLIPIKGSDAPSGGQSVRSMGTKPLAGPLFAARQAARASGKLRHRQGYVIHEVVYEYIKLRQLLWDTLRASSLTEEGGTWPELPMYLDRVLDEVMSSAIESFHESATRDLEKRAIHDSLTEMYNKEYFRRQLHIEMRRALRYNEPLTLAMLDMDLLKAINDTYGHQAGDAVIVAVSKAICDTCRQSDIPCRYGGDEFAVILPETPKLQAQVFAERVQRALQKLTIVIGSPDLRPAPGDAPPQPSSEVGRTSTSKGTAALTIPAPSLSIGLASFPEDGRNPETMIAKADAALYRAKRAGRNKISL